MSVTAEQATRWCAGCEQELPLSAFYSSTPRGHCASCRRKDQKDRYSGVRPRQMEELTERVNTLERMVEELSRKVA